MDCNAAGNGGSIRGPNNVDYLLVVKDRPDSFRVYNPTIKKEQVPVKLMTASGSGLDLHLSSEGALVQVDSVARQEIYLQKK